MPDKETLDKAALDYGVLLASTQKVRQEKADLETEIKALQETRGMLNDENAKTQDATVRVRGELIEAQKQVESVKKMKLEEIDNEKRLLEDQRQKLGKATQELQEVEEVLKRRTIEVETRERNLRDAQAANETRAQQVNQEASRIETMEREVTVLRDSVVEREKKLYVKEEEVEGKLRKVKDTENSIISLQNQNRSEMNKATEDRRIANVKLNELAVMEERMDSLRKETKLFCDVAKEAITFIQQNVKNYDQIDAYFRERFPALVNRLNNV